MDAMNSEQLKRKYGQGDQILKLTRLRALSLLFRASLFPRDYKPTDLFGTAIVLTPQGEHWLQRVEMEMKEVTVAEAKLALFLLLVHHEPYVDASATDCEAVRQALGADILRGGIRYPWAYGHLLYDRFYDLFATPPDRLTYEETIKLLEGTPQGVFQLADTVVGPFGALCSGCCRELNPTTTLPLWHCPEPACTVVHRTSLRAGDCGTLRALGYLQLETAKEEGSPSDWDSLFTSQIRTLAGNWYDGMHAGHLPSLLANAFSTRELRCILRRLLSEHSKEMRERFPKAGGFEKTLKGSAEQISGQLGDSQLLQLALLVPNEIIVDCIESAIGEGEIGIPPTELRTPVRALNGYGMWDITCQCSQFGVRFISRVRPAAPVRLKALINYAYSDSEGRKQLDWKMRYMPGASSEEKMANYIHGRDPKEILRETVFDSPNRVKKAFEYLRYGHFEIAPSEATEKQLIDKMLWKVGFDIPLYPTAPRLFRERLRKLQETMGERLARTEEDKEVIRGVSANFFVSLEEILDSSLAFVTWALLSDHYGTTKFTFRMNEARSLMATRLSNLRKGPNDDLLVFDPGGKNTLYPLIQGFGILADLCNEIDRVDKHPHLRSKSETPRFCGRSDVDVFPFRHRLLFLDMSEADRKLAVLCLAETAASLEKSNICSVRNRIEHRRPDFPSRDEMEKGVNAVQAAVDKLEDAGFCPLLFTYAGEKEDEYHRREVLLRDYRSREVAVRLPSQFDGCRLPSLMGPQVVVRSLHIGDSPEMMRFRYEEESDYTGLWRGYPRKRLTVDADEVLQ